MVFDPNGREWVNSHTVNIKSINEALLKSPNDKKLLVKLKEEKVNEVLVNKFIADIKSNDISLYNYIDNLKVSDQNGKTANVKAYVSVDDIPSNGENAHTEYSEIKGYYVNYGNKKIIAPRSDKGPISFDIVIYGKNNGDEYLSNEAGDIMYYMEYNKDAVNEGSNAQYFEPGKGGDDAYRNSSSGKYSDKVESKYIERKKSGEGKDASKNPYPLAK